MHEKCLRVNLEEMERELERWATWMDRKEGKLEDEDISDWRRVESSLLAFFNAYTSQREECRGIWRVKVRELTRQSRLCF